MNAIGLSCFILSWITMYFIALLKRSSRREAICFSTMTWLATLFFLTEILSRFQAISIRWITICWAILELVEIVYYVLKSKTKHTFRSLSLRSKVERIENDIKDIKNDNISIFLLAIILILLVRSLWLAVNTVPYNWDSMTYHLSRIMFWIEHRSVSYYETNIIRQIVSPVFAEYVNLHVFLLTGSDKFANLVQNISLFGSAFFVISIIGEFVSDRKWKYLGGILLITMNAVYAESTSTQVDLFAAFLMLTLVYQIILLCKKENLEMTAGTITDFIVMGISAGLLYITKGNACIPAAFIVVIGVIIRILKKDKITRLLLLCVLACFSAVLIAFPTFYRNFKHTGDIFASNYIGGIAAGTLNPKYLITNAVKNYTNVAVGHQNAEFLKNLTNWVGTVLKTDVNSADISFGSITYEIGYSTHMDTAGAHLIAPLLIIASLIGIVRLFVFRNQRELIMISLLFQFYISIMAIRWQPWVVRLLIPSLCLLVPAIVYYLESLFHVTQKARENWSASIKPILSILLMTLIIFTCISNNFDEFSYLQNIALRNINASQSRFELYFTGRGNGAYYTQMCETIDASQCSRIGLFTGEDSYQYPLLVKYYGEKSIENVTLNKNDYDSKMNISFHPEIIAVANLQLDTGSTYYCNGIQYSCVNDLGSGYSLWAISQQ